MKLMMRPRWQDGESWCGYLMRLARFNAIPGLAEFAKLGGITYAEIVSGQPAKVLRQLGVDHQGVPPVLMPQRNDEPMSRLPKARRPQYTTLCPECLRTDEVPFFRQRWDYPLEVTCITHKVRLLVSCPKCTRQVQVRRGLFLRCGCGMPFADWKSIPDDFTSDKLRKILSLGLPAETSLTFQPAAELELAALVMLRNLAYSSGLRVNAMTKELPRLVNPIDRLAILQRALPWFENWPLGFEEMLRQTGWKPGYVGENFLSRKALRLSKFSALAHLVDGLVRSRAVARGAQEHAANMQEDTHRMSSTQAQRFLGISKIKFVSWKAAGVFGGVEAERKRGYFLHFLSREAVEDVRHLLQHTISFQDACERLGLSPRTLHILVESEILQGVRLQRATSTARLDPLEVRDFSRRLLSVAKPVRLVDNMRPFAGVIEATYKRAGKSSVAALIAEISTRGLPLYRRQSAENSLSNLFVPPLELQRHFTRVRRGLTVLA